MLLPMNSEGARWIDNRTLADKVTDMSIQQLSREALALPLAERAALAQALWVSIDDGMPVTDERAAVADALRRDEELSAGIVIGRTHVEVMEAARRAIA